MKKIIHTRREILSGIVAMPLLTAIAPMARAQEKKFAGRRLVATGFGGGPQEIIDAAVYAPFEAATGAETTQVPLYSAAGLARMKSEVASPLIDLYTYSGGQEMTAKAEALTQPITAPNLNKLPANLRDPDANWAIWAVIAEGILYRTDKIPEPPKSYNDFLKEEYRGHIAFPNITNGYGLDFLVMLARANGGGENDIEPGFEALKKIRTETIFGTTAEIPTLFAQNDIWILPYDVGNAYRLKQSGLPIAMSTPVEGSPAVLISACIAKNSENADVASGVVEYMLRPESQIEIAEKMRYSPTNPDAVMPEDLAKEVPSISSMAFLDRSVMLAQRAAWTERFNREVAG